MTAVVCLSRLSLVQPLNISISDKVADLLVKTGVGFGVGVVASVILFRSAFRPHAGTLSSQASPRTYLAHSTLVRLRHGCCLRRLRSLVQSRTRTRHPHHNATGGDQIDVERCHCDLWEGRFHSCEYTLIRDVALPSFTRHCAFTTSPKS
ncbi:hypothetical protein J3R82DRAFT_8089 [Butyriboletus roseoflavus]|nr:hypothetical protein J3R82DRAFT_8089 [Butyriboletus roseoflavus]